MSYSIKYTPDTHIFTYPLNNDYEYVFDREEIHKQCLFLRKKLPAIIKCPFKLKIYI